MNYRFIEDPANIQAFYYDLETCNDCSFPFLLLSNQKVFRSDIFRWKETIPLGDCNIDSIAVSNSTI